MIGRPAGRHQATIWHTKTPPWWSALVTVVLVAASAAMPMQLSAAVRHAPPTRHRATVVSSPLPRWPWVVPYPAASATPIPAASSEPSPGPSLTARAAPLGSPQQIAAAMLSQFGWSSDQMSCLEPLWQRESGWEVSAYNASSGAFGIPQALPGSKMASAGPDWQTSAYTQIKWGLGYIQEIYGSPCAAWDHEEADGWY